MYCKSLETDDDMDLDLNDYEEEDWSCLRDECDDSLADELAQMDLSSDNDEEMSVEDGGDESDDDASYNSQQDYQYRDTGYGLRSKTRHLEMEAELTDY